MGRGRKKEYWSQDDIEKEIRRVMELLGIEHMPRAIDLKTYSSVLSAIHRTGGMRQYAAQMGIAMAPSQRPENYTTKNKPREEVAEKWEGRPSMAFEIEAKARKQGLSYADLQKEETLRMAGGITC